MNFKKFNGTTWETVQHKIYGSGTEQLASFPAQIQAAGEPLTDYLISGNTLQNGTPTPEAPVDVQGCGVWDETYQSYKLALTVNGTEYPIYLGEVPTTRRIKKLVLTGEENWQIRTDGTYIFYIILSAMKVYAPCKASHYKYIVRSVPSTMLDGEITTALGSGVAIWIKSDDYTTTDGFKSYLAAQYTNGTPVTVWYALAEPETAVVNEPLMKIGDYADTISAAQAEVAIQTSDGDNTISFGTTLKPSGMSAAFKGWHPVQGAKQYDGSEWR